MTGFRQDDSPFAYAASNSPVALFHRLLHEGGEPAIDRSTRTFIVEVEVPNATGLLKPGGFAKARILISQDENATTIHLAGLYSFAGIHKVFLVRNGTAQEIKVTLGEQSNDWVEIASPTLPSDSVVITSGQRLLSDGIPISVRETTK